MGSVKDLTVIRPPTSSQMGHGTFNFSDRYSVFDWGEMPDNIKYKGAALAMMSAYFFEQMQNSGVPTHYRGMQVNGRTYTTDQLREPSTGMAVDLVGVVKPKPIMKDGDTIGFDYSEFQNPLMANVLVPLEVIYRNTLPRGSSVFRRLREGTLTLQEMGLEQQPQEGAVLPQPFFDASTKLEPFDRYLAWTEAQRISGLSDIEIARMKEIASEGDKVITEGVGRAGLDNDDGKLEFALTPQRNLILADALGTLDECRFTYPTNGQRIEVSKEIPRQWYRVKQPEWVAEIDAAKKASPNWKPIVKLRPEPLPQALAEMLGYVYASVANAVLQRQLFDAPPLDTVVKEYQRFRELEMKS